jgi:hypothetical protein
MVPDDLNHPEELLVGIWGVDNARRRYRPQHVGKGLLLCGIHLHNLLNLTLDCQPALNNLLIDKII